MNMQHKNRFLNKKITVYKMIYLYTSIILNFSRNVIYNECKYSSDKLKNLNAIVDI